ncbi:MAG TPA: hypothetical protein DGG94_15555 [Micromonosporaceae bacterium]|nr:hypothetical protein [Micromonosporaceae bacterium]
MRLAALEEWFEARLAAGSDPELIAELTQHVAANPLSEQLVAQLMVALHRSGRRADAMATFRLTRERLVSELGVEPGAELQRLHQQILAADQEPSLTGTGMSLSRNLAAQLPMAVPAFIGREAALKALDMAAFVATITGTAGVGKSALAVQWAHRVQGRFPDGQLFVNLRGFDPERSAVDPGEALLGFLDALGVPPERVPASTEARAALYRSMLADKRILVLLDNAWDVEQVRPLLPGAPGSLAVVTSRDQLAGLIAVEGAHPVNLDVLSDAEAVDLLTARLGVARLKEHRDAVARIVNHCAGLPLALAVVAASSAIQPGSSLDEIASDLDDDAGSLDAFGSADPKADVRSVFSWSYRALSTHAARLFRLLGLHPGPDISVAAAASLAGTTGSIARGLLHELNRAHLVAQHQHGRFSSHDLLKTYANELAGTMDEEERNQALSRLLDHYLHTSYAAAGLLDPNRERIAVDACQPGVIVTALSTHDEAMAWFDAEHPALVGAVGRSFKAGFDVHAWKLAWSMSTYLRRHSHGRDWISTQTTALQAAQRSTDLIGQANAAFSLAMAQFRYGSRSAADSALQLAVEHFGQLEDHYGLASAYHLHCLHSEADGDFAAAFSYAVKGLEQYQLSGHFAGQGRALGAMGWYQAKLGNFQRGLEHCRAALELSQAANDVPGVASVWDSIGHIQLHLGDLDEAVDGYSRSTSLYRELGDRYNLVQPLIGLGYTHFARGETDLADVAWQEALAVCVDLGHPELASVQAKLIGQHRHGQAGILAEKDAAGD